MRRLSIMVAALLAAGAPAACGTAAQAPGATPATGTPAVGGDHNAADVAFVEALIASHRTGIELAQAAGRRPAAHILAEAIVSTQQDELTRMTGWLHTWGVTDAPAATPKLPAGDPVTALAAHQEQAITLAQREQAQGSNSTALAFAKQVIESRTAEATQLRAAAAPAHKQL